MTNPDNRLAGGATQPQLDYIVGLLAERDVTEESVTKAQAIIDRGELTKPLASKWIQRLLSLPRRGNAISNPSDDDITVDDPGRPSHKNMMSTPGYLYVEYMEVSRDKNDRPNYAGILLGASAPVPRGSYAILTPEDSDNPIKFYQVWISDKDHPRYGSGKWNVKVCHGPDETVLNKGAQARILRVIAEQGPLACAQRYGHEIGKCGICGRRLTNKTSRDMGIGPVCAGRYHA